MSLDYDQSPFLIIWETTRACDLTCSHCRAEAMPEPDPGELNTEEAIDLLDQAAQCGAQVFVFSGGDPLKRPDIRTLVRHAATSRLRTGLIPAVSPSLSERWLRDLKEDGLDQAAFSLDSADEASHDRLRGAPGIYRKTLQAVGWASSAGLATQINSMINTHNFDRLDELISLIESLPIVFWEVFFLVPMGRGQNLDILSADQFEEAFEKIHAAQRRNKFVLKVTEAPHYRRYVARLTESPVAAGASAIRPELPSMLRRQEGPGGSIGHAPKGVNAGKGFVFVSRTGDIMPSGFLPLSGGNIRRNRLSEVYRNGPLFKILRDVSRLKGRCGRCAYADICGGSRARAYAMTGDFLAEDPCCSFQP